MNPSDPFGQMRRQQEQMRKQQEMMQRQQEQLRRQQGMAWQQEQERKRKRHQREAQLQGGGVNISGSQLDLGGDIVGRDKVHAVSATYPRDEKSGCALFIEQVFMLAIGLVTGGVFFGIIGAIAFAVMGGPEEMIPLIIIGVIIGAGISGVSSANHVSRYRD